MWYKLKHIFLLIPGFFLLLNVTSIPSYAYIDPGSGSYFAQMAIASAVSFFAFVLKPLLSDIKHLFSKKNPSKNEETLKNKENANKK